MPGGDRTGPVGMGPMTGWGRGYCAGYAVPGYLNAGAVGWAGPRGFAGRGMRAGFGGGGRGFRHRFYATGVPGWMGSGVPYPGVAYGPAGQAESTILAQQAEDLKAALSQIQKRLDELNQEKTHED